MWLPYYCDVCTCRVREVRSLAISWLKVCPVKYLLLFDIYLFLINNLYLNKSLTCSNLVGQCKIVSAIVADSILTWRTVFFISLPIIIRYPSTCFQIINSLFYFNCHFTRVLCHIIYFIKFNLSMYKMSTIDIPLQYISLIFTYNYNHCVPKTFPNIVKYV